MRRTWLCVLGVAALLLAVSCDGIAPGSDGAAHDSWQRPFTRASIWNTKVGSGAQFSSAGPRPAANGVYPDPVHLIRATASDPEVTIMQAGGWFNRCSGTKSIGLKVRIPASLLIGDVTSRDSQPNSHLVVLQPDGHTIVQLAAAARCNSGGPLFGYSYGFGNVVSDLSGDGRFGSHASQLSTLGGAIRPGELTSAAPISHALDLEFWEFDNYYYGGSGAGCYRWPANSCDSYAAAMYRGTNPDFKIGALLAIPPGVTPESLGITTAAALKIFQALKDYGGYATESTAWSAFNISIDAAALGEFPEGTARDEVSRIMTALRVVTNNGPKTVGGGTAP